MKSIWNTLLLSLGQEDSTEEWNFLSQHYSEKGRAYHNLDHIADCLQKWQSLEINEHTIEMQLAIWYHDVIYNAHHKNNEEQSAKRAIKFLQSIGLSPDRQTIVYDLIMATKHTSAPKNQLEAYLMDIDISILGAEPKVYDLYTEKIRKEYQWVPNLLYKKGRVKVLTMFLERNTLYYTPSFEEQYDEKARQNLQREIDLLEA